jgi:hypothetical protein
MTLPHFARWQVASWAAFVAKLKNGMIRVSLSSTILFIEQ